jgi:hypothetical protein
MSDMKGIWNLVSIWCLNHDEPKEMTVQNNTELIKTPFYACPDYPACSNRLNLDDYQGLVLKFIQEVSKNPLCTDFTNYSFTYRGTRQKIFVKVLRYTDKEIRLGILNKTVLLK